MMGHILETFAPSMASSGRDVGTEMVNFPRVTADPFTCCKQVDANFPTLCVKMGFVADLARRMDQGHSYKYGPDTFSAAQRGTVLSVV